MKKQIMGYPVCWPEFGSSKFDQLSCKVLSQKNRDTGCNSALIAFYTNEKGVST